MNACNLGITIWLISIVILISSSHCLVLVYYDFSVSCRFLCHTLADSTIQEVIACVGVEQEVNLIHGWFRCHWYLLAQSESLQLITRSVTTYNKHLTKAHSEFKNHKIYFCFFSWRKKIKTWSLSLVLKSVYYLVSSYVKLYI
jgi:hypothetical protein